MGWMGEDSVDRIAARPCVVISAGRFQAGLAESGEADPARGRFGPFAQRPEQLPVAQLEGALDAGG